MKKIILRDFKWESLLTRIRKNVLKLIAKDCYKFNKLEYEFTS